MQLIQGGLRSQLGLQFFNLSDKIRLLISERKKKNLVLRNLTLHKISRVSDVPAVSVHVLALDDTVSVQCITSLPQLIERLPVDVALAVDINGQFFDVAGDHTVGLNLNRVCLRAKRCELILKRQQDLLEIVDVISVASCLLVLGFVCFNGLTKLLALDRCAIADRPHFFIKVFQNRQFVEDIVFNAEVVLLHLLNVFPKVLNALEQERLQKFWIVSLLWVLGKFFGDIH